MGSRTGPCPVFDWMWIVLAHSHTCFFSPLLSWTCCIFFKSLLWQKSTFNFTVTTYTPWSLCSEYRWLFTLAEYVLVKGQTYTFTVKCITELHESVLLMVWILCLEIKYITICSFAIDSNYQYTCKLVNFPCVSEPLNVGCKRPLHMSSLYSEPRMYPVYLFIVGPLHCFCQCCFIKKIAVN